MDKVRKSKLTQPVVDGLNCISLRSLPNYFSGLNLGQLSMAGITTLGDLFVESEVDGFVKKIKNAQQFKEITGSTNILKIKYLDDIPMIGFDINRSLEVVCDYCGFKEKTVSYLASHNINSFSGFIIFMNNIDNPEYATIPESVKGELVDKYNTIDYYYKIHDFGNPEDLTPEELQAIYDRLVEKKENELRQYEELREPMTYGPK